MTHLIYGPTSERRTGILTPPPSADPSMLPLSLDWSGWSAGLSSFTTFPCLRRGYDFKRVKRFPTPLRLCLHARHGGNGRNYGFHDFGLDTASSSVQPYLIRCVIVVRPIPVRFAHSVSFSVKPSTVTYVPLLDVRDPDLTCFGCMSAIDVHPLATRD
jgi:hypothetical protein